MKKALIAGAASVALAAMPVVGVFAELSDQTSVEDTVQLTVQKTCKMQAEQASGTYNLGTFTAGNGYTETTGTPMTLTCNAQAGWTLSAAVNAMTASGTDQTIPFGALGTTTSVWSAKIAVTGSDAGNAQVATGWDDYTATTGGTILSAKGEAGAKKAVNAIVVTPSYDAYAAANQAAGSYSAKITYTFADLTQ